MDKTDLKKIILIIISLAVISSVLRFYKLAEYPIQLNHDEVSQIYDLASVMKNGKDVYDNYMPFAFPSTGDFKPGHYIYISTIPYLLFGDSEFTIRIAGAFFGSLLPIWIFLLLLTTTRNITLSLISGLLIAINPSDIFYSRKSFEHVISVSLLYASFAVTAYYLKRYRKLWFGAFGVLLLVSSMYIYTSEVIIAPLLAITFFIIYRRKFLIYKHHILTLVALLILLVLPLVFLTQTNKDLKFRALSVYVSQDRILGEKLDKIKYLPLPEHLIMKQVITAEYIFDRYLRQFNPTYIFGNGLFLTNQGFIGMGPLMFVELPFFLLGLLYLIKNKQKNSIFFAFPLFFAIGFIPSALTFEEYSPHRAMFSFTSAAIIAAFGVYVFISFVNRLKIENFFKFTILGLITLSFTLNIAYFYQMYTLNWQFEKSEHFHYPFKNIALFAWENYQKFDQIVIDPVYGEYAPTQAVATHYYLAYYGNYPPEKFQKDLKINEKGMYFDQFEIRKVIWRDDQDLKNVLIIASPWSLPIKEIPKEKVIKTFYFVNKQPAYYAIKL